MAGELFHNQPAHEAEFWKRYRIMKAMLGHIERQEVLVEGLKHESSIPESARDLAIKAVEAEVSANRKIFHDFLVNYISYGTQGLHRMDIDIRFTLVEGTAPENRGCTLNIEGMAHPLPLDIGQAILERLVELAGEHAGSFPARIIDAYKRIESHYDLVSGGDLDRCSLTLSEELFPCRCYHVTVRFPARILLEEELARWEES